MGKHFGNDFDVDDDSLDLSQAIIDIGLHINTVKVTTVGEIRRTFPQHERVVWSMLKDLKLDGLANFDEHSPAPTRVTNQPMQFASPRHWNNSALYAKTGSDSRAVPDSDSYRDPKRRVLA